MPSKLNFILIGLPGVGKTTITREHYSIKHGKNMKKLFFLMFIATISMASFANKMS